MAVRLSQEFKAAQASVRYGTNRNPVSWDFSYFIVSLYVSDFPNVKQIVIQSNPDSRYGIERIYFKSTTTRTVDCSAMFSTRRAWSRGGSSSAEGHCHGSTTALHMECSTRSVQLARYSCSSRLRWICQNARNPQPSPPHLISKGYIDIGEPIRPIRRAVRTC